jgi:HlyD family secretion protein
MKRWLRRIGILVVLVAAGFALRYTVFKPKPVDVTVFRVAAGRVEDSVTNSKAGTVETRRRAAISPEIGGRVGELLVREGDRVTKRQVLMRLVDDDYRARVEVADRARDAAVATEREACLARDQAERDLGRYLRLREDEIVSQELLDQLQNIRDTAVARCQAMRAELQKARSAQALARVELAKTVLHAPFDGIVTEVSTEVGEWITPSPPGVPIPPVIEVLDPDAIYIEIPLDEADVGSVRKGLPVRITLDAYPGRSFMGAVTRVAAFVSDEIDQNRTFDVEVELEDQEFARTLLPGASADAEVILDARDDVLRIPSYALMEGGRVLVVRDEHLAEISVETGLRNWQFTEVVSGLARGDPVVVSLDRVEVVEGARVRIAGETLK